MFAMLKYLTFPCRPLSPYGILQQKPESLFSSCGSSVLECIFGSSSVILQPISQTIQQQFQCHNFDRRHPNIPSKPLISRLSLDLPARLASMRANPIYSMAEFFPDIKTIEYEGADSKNPLAFKHYNADEVIEGKSMKDHLRFGIAYWHTMRGMGNDPLRTAVRPWESGTDDVQMPRTARGCSLNSRRNSAHLSIASTTAISHPREARCRRDDNLDAGVRVKEEQARTGIQLLWGTANFFSNPRFMHGAATSCNADVFAYAASQVKKMLEVTKELGGENYVFWGGREGYQCRLNTDMQRELDHLAKFMHMAVDYAKKIGFTGQFLFEPKPKEPTKHQYDFDAAACLNFIRANGLEDYVKLNIETNHATLAGHTMEHELDYAGGQGFLGSIDANTGDLLLGWDTDQFPTDIYLTTKSMLAILKHGGIAGGVNFDAKVRRESHERSISSTRTSAAWTPLPAASKLPPPSAPTGALRRQ